jgi:hypothetical protein
MEDEGLYVTLAAHGRKFEQTLSLTTSLEVDRLSQNTDFALVLVSVFNQVLSWQDQQSIQPPE